MTNDPERPGDEHDDLLRPFGGESDEWLEALRSAETARRPGRIGDYEVLDEVRGGGQGLVFRARHVTTGLH